MKFATILALAVAAGTAEAGETRIGELSIRDAWARATIGQGKTGVVYLTVVNHGGEADRLVAAETAVAKRAALHRHLHEGGVMKMRPVEAIEVAGAGTAVLEPGADHLMLMGLSDPLQEGGSFRLTLVFEKAGRVEVPVTIMSATAMQPAGHSGQGRGHGSGHHGTRKQ